ncbi:hypothetical protein CKQ53_14000 [Lonsdalea britannica]|uniref:Uncharacterized protein n=1 Tax=Lonsdalea britannica TaxID=1082704 RepID=A0AAD0SIJ3_9GAMM|nr:hypothetical protein CKQ53_14000 [Lonsdalea britannica]
MINEYFSRDVIVFKKLVTGQLSLPMTFWGWGFCGGFFIGLIGMAGVHTGHVFLIPLCYILKATGFDPIYPDVFALLRLR